ncbi:hypothetical protein ACFFUP_06065 [Vibrio ostreicida]|uniref:Uncharacterized protein n=2 Tax=Vibrio ostreicida TaxID=526588 RepID=A0ABT8BYB6_9VIBR|nr:hypothetical protein [Vibrio ostreicida]MDN3611817.1 hypothetical protein [Vibrio ostreicida]NPD09631.1 hypothetical protein [Vibrio ostreicida]
MQYFLVIATLSIMIAISSYTQSQSGNIHFSGTRWVCAEEKSGFIRKSYDQYQRITQTHTLFFTSDTMVSQYYSGTLIHKNGLEENFELVYTASYQTHGQALKINVKSIDWNEKPERSPMFIKYINALKNQSIDTNYYAQDGYLYLYNNSQSEDSNLVCYAT